MKNSGTRIQRRRKSKDGRGDGEGSGDENDELPGGRRRKERESSKPAQRQLGRKGSSKASFSWVAASLWEEGRLVEFGWREGR